VQSIVVREIEALAADGVPYVQIDSPCYSSCAAETERKSTAGLDAAAALDLMLAADNACLRAARRHGATTSIHICRGNNRGRWQAEGSYEPFAERVFSALEVDRLLLEYDTERAGGLEPLRFVPKDKMVVLGLVSTKERRLETPDELLGRIEAAAKYVAPDQLALSPQCGFASISEGHPLSWADQQRKLELVVDVARRAWG